MGDWPTHCRKADPDEYPQCVGPETDRRLSLKARSNYVIFLALDVTRTHPYALKNPDDNFSLLARPIREYQYLTMSVGWFMLTR